MATQEKNGKWAVKCPICTWKTTEESKQKAENSLANHIEIVHKKGRKGVKKHKLLIPPRDMPPNLPAPIKERSSIIYTGAFSKV
jgi:hypothetical protein